MRNLATLAFTISLLISTGTTNAAEPESWIDALSIGYGEDNIDEDQVIYFGRLGVQKEYGRRWFESDFGYLSGYFELAYNRWTRSEERISNVSVTPMLRYHFHRFASNLHPYVYAGIGLSHSNSTKLSERDLSSQFLFEDSLGFGFELGRFDFSLGAVHYSNLDIEEPNDGLTAYFGKISYRASLSEFSK